MMWYRVTLWILIVFVFSSAVFINIYFALVLFILFVVNLFLREFCRQRRFNPWVDARRNFDVLVIGEKRDVRKIPLSSGEILEETVWGRSLYASFHILRTYFSLLKCKGKVYIIYRQRFLTAFSPMDMAIVTHPVTLSIMGIKHQGLKRKFPVWFSMVHWWKMVFSVFTIPNENTEESLILQIREFCEERQLKIEFVKI